jgi:hypothetical protein
MPRRTFDGVRNVYAPNACAVTWWVCLAALSVCPCAFAAAKPTPLDLALEALAAAESRLVSGRGHGTFRSYRGEGELIQEIAFRMAFDHEKFNIQLEYRTVPDPRQGDDRRAIVCDGSAIFANRFSPRIHPAGCQTDVYEAKREMIRYAGSPFDFRRLSAYALGDPSERKENFEKYDIAFEELADGKYLARYVVSDNWEGALEIAPDCGYLIVRNRAGNKTGEITYVDYKLDWKQQEGVWYIAGLTKDSQEVGGVRYHHVLEFDEFEVNPVVPPETFTLAALEPCEGSRFIDRRPDATTRIHYYESPEARKTDQQELDNMLAEVEALPASRRPAPPEEAHTGRSWRLGVVLVGILSLAAIVAVVYVLRRRGERRA